MGCVLSDIKNARLGTGRSSQGIEGYGGDPLWRRRPALGCSANEEEEEDEYTDFDISMLFACSAHYLSSAEAPAFCLTQGSVFLYAILTSCNTGY